MVVAYIDLYRFRTVNDLYGRQIGDRLLVAVAGRLVVATEAGELIARCSGEAFVVVAPCARGIGFDDAQPEQTAGQGAGPGRPGAVAGAPCRNASPTSRAGPFILGETVISYAGASIGTAISRPGEDAGALLARADQAMYEARNRTIQSLGRPSVPGAEAPVRRLADSTA